MLKLQVFRVLLICERLLIIDNPTSLFSRRVHVICPTRIATTKAPVEKQLEGPFRLPVLSYLMAPM